MMRNSWMRKNLLISMRTGRDRLDSLQIINFQLIISSSFLSYAQFIFEFLQILYIHIKVQRINQWKTCFSNSGD